MLTLAGVRCTRFILSCLVLGLALADARGQAKRDAESLYQALCSSCHGNDMKGGQTDSLLDDVWKHGGDDASLTKIIAEGYEQGGMPKWKPELNDAEIRSLVVLIRERHQKAQYQAADLPKPLDDHPVPSKEHTFRLKSVVEGLSTPWSVAFLPDGRMLVTELPGRLRVVRDGQLQAEAVQGTPKVLAVGQGGLMEVAPHPGYATNGWIYLGFSDPAPSGDRVGLTAIVRGRLKGNQWSDQEVVFRAPYELYRPGNVHFGTRLVFDKGYLFFSIGERGHMQDAQDLTRPNGKVHRIFDDGRIPPDNPFAGQSNAFPTIWTYGNRNPQGLDKHPVTGELWETEHGPRGGDELNWIRKGLNYGWPVITYGMNYNGTPITGITAKEGLEQPIIHWTPSIAVCGIDFYEGDKFPKWKNNLFVTALAQQELRRLVIDGHRVVSQEVLFKNIGRVRDVHSGPDGYLYVTFNKPDRIARLEPVP
jgi:glucose/arabinose dehydrogenase